MIYATLDNNNPPIDFNTVFKIFEKRADRYFGNHILPFIAPGKDGTPNIAVILAAASLLGEGAHLQTLIVRDLPPVGDGKTSNLQVSASTFDELFNMLTAKTQNADLSKAAPVWWEFEDIFAHNIDSDAGYCLRHHNKLAIDSLYSRADKTRPLTVAELSVLLPEALYAPA